MYSGQESFDSNACGPSNLFEVACNMCQRKKVAKSVCTTCYRYLCDSCEFAHKMMICFETHSVVLLCDIEKMAHFEKILQKAAACHPETTDSLRKQYIQEKEHLEQMVKRSRETTVKIDLLKIQRCNTIAYINELYNQSQQYFQEEKERIINALDARFITEFKDAVRRKELFDSAIETSIAKLSNFNLIVDGKSDESHSQLFATTSNSIFPPPLNALEQQEETAPENSWMVSLNFGQGTPTPLFNQTTGPIMNGDVNPFASFNFPDLVSAPRDLKCHVNPDLSLSSNPVSSPHNENHINSMQLHKTVGQKGHGSSQFMSPHGFCLGYNEDIVVADSSNHRIQIFNQHGMFKFEFGIAGRNDGFLWYPRKVAFLASQRSYVVCDRGYERSRMQIFSKDGIFQKKIQLQFIEIVAGIAVTEREEIVVVDSVTPTVFIIGPNDFFRTIDCTAYIQEPSDIAVANGDFYICDFKGHNVVVIDRDGNLLRKFGDKRTTIFPNGIDVSTKGDVLVGDSHGNFFHIVAFNKHGTLVAEFRCPYMKVSRCCGLKIRSDGRLVTVDKNYHHFIVLEALYVPPEHHL